MIKVGVVIPARNEAWALPYTITSLKNQSLKPSIIVVVDDGSTDNTAEVAKRLGAIVVRLERSFDFSATGTPYLAYVINKGLELLRDMDLDFIMISGAECIYPRDYISRLVNRMVKERVVLASGVAVGERTSIFGVRGAGRLILTSWFKKIGFRYPLNYGYETWLIFKALSQGLKVKVYHDIRFYLLRETRMGETKAYLYGKAMYALGYSTLFMLGRAIQLSLTRRNKSILANMIRGFYNRTNIRRYEDPVLTTVKRFQALRMLRLKF